MKDYLAAICMYTVSTFCNAAPVSVHVRKIFIIMDGMSGKRWFIEILKNDFWAKRAIISFFSYFNVTDLLSEAKVGL